MSVFTVLNPATEEPVTTVDQVSLEETDEAIARAAAAWPAWRAVAPGDRARLLRAFAALVDAHVEELAGLEVAGSGHPVGAARWEAGQVRDVLQYYSAAPERLIGQQIPVPGGLNITFHEPLGVVGLIVPWNFPMPILSWGMAPALAAGCVVVAKPAEVTPLTAMRIAALALEAGLPEGVFQVLPGKGSVVGQRLVDHPAVRKIVFTGSTEVGRADHGRLRAPDQAAHARAGRQERQHHLRRLRPGAGRGDRAVRGVRQRGPGLLRPVPDPGPGVRCSTSSWPCSSRRCAAWRWVIRRRRRPRWGR